MLDLNDLRVFERVAALKGFSAASHALDIPKSSVSRSVRRLEAHIATPLLHRTTREVTLTEAGAALFARCAGLIDRLDQTVDYVGSLKDGPRGSVRISTGIGFGINVLAELLPSFAALYPNVSIALDLSSDPADLVSDRIDVAIRFGPLPDSSIVAKRLGVLHRYLCASPSYLTRRGTPTSFEELVEHDLIALPIAEGCQPPLIFRRGLEAVKHRQSPRFSVNCALTIHRLILNGAGIGLSSGYLCGPEIEAGRMVRLLAEWTLPSVPVHAVFPSHREHMPAIRAFIDFMGANCWEGRHWQADPIAPLVDQAGAACLSSSSSSPRPVSHEP